MAQTIKIRRGGIDTLATTAPGSIGSGIAAGELILGTGSFNGLTGPLLLAANAANTVSPAYSRIDTIADGPTLEAAIGAAGDVNLTGLTIHSGSKFYRYSGVNSTGFEELTVAAGTFEGNYVASITDASNNGLSITGGTGNASTPTIALDLADLTSAILAPSTDSIPFVDSDGNATRLESIADMVSAMAGTNVGASSGQFTVANASDSTKGVVELATTSEASTGTSTTLAVTPAGLTQFIADATGSIAAGSVDLVNSNAINALSASIATDIAANEGSVSGTTNQVAYFNGASSVAGDAGMTYNAGTDVLTVGNSTFGTNVTVAGDLTVQGTTTTVNSETLNVSSSIVRVNFGGAVANGGMEVTDATGGTIVTGSLLWDGTNDYWIAGPKASEKRIVRLNADMANNSFVIAKGEDLIDDVAASTAGDILQWNGSSMVASNVIDGGTF